MLGLPQISRRAFHAGVLASGGAGLFLPGTVEGQDTLLIIHTPDDGWINFRGRRDTEKVHVATIKSIGRGLGGKTVRVRHGGGRLRMANGVKDFYDFLATVKGMNPAIDIRGF